MTLTRSTLPTLSALYSFFFLFSHFIYIPQRDFSSSFSSHHRGKRKLTSRRRRRRGVRMMMCTVHGDYPAARDAAFIPEDSLRFATGYEYEYARMARAVWFSFSHQGCFLYVVETIIYKKKEFFLSYIMTFCVLKPFYFIFFLTIIKHKKTVVGLGDYYSYDTLVASSVIYTAARPRSPDTHILVAVISCSPLNVFPTPPPPPSSPSLPASLSSSSWCSSRLISPQILSGSHTSSPSRT